MNFTLLIDNLADQLGSAFAIVGAAALNWRNDADAGVGGYFSVKNCRLREMERFSTPHF
jgi:hypothetical protein